LKRRDSRACRPGAAATAGRRWRRWQTCGS
jgi:hypothetical protein